MADTARVSRWQGGAHEAPRHRARGKPAARGDGSMCSPRPRASREEQPLVLGFVWFAAARGGATHGAAGMGVRVEGSGVCALPVLLGLRAGGRRRQQPRRVPLAQPGAEGVGRLTDLRVENPRRAAWPCAAATGRPVRPRPALAKRASARAHRCSECAWHRFMMTLVLARGELSPFFLCFEERTQSTNCPQLRTRAASATTAEEQQYQRGCPRRTPQQRARPWFPRANVGVPWACRGCPFAFGKLALELVRAQVYLYPVLKRSSTRRTSPHTSTYAADRLPAPATHERARV